MTSQEDARILYNMDLHEVSSIDNFTRIMRVPGGWIYYTFIKQNGTFIDELNCFVPFDGEFKRLL